MEKVREYLDLQGRRATVYFLWRRALVEYQEASNGSVFLQTIAEVTQELRLIRELTQSLCQEMTAGQDIALRIEALEDQHLREMVQYQQGKIQGQEVSAVSVADVEEGISELLQELQGEDTSSPRS